ncbi:MAG: hypothetical protein J0I93_00580 [Legionella sp.]|nr:hypothetical protein [Legionella sp.]
MKNRILTAAFLAVIANVGWSDTTVSTPTPTPSTPPVSGTQPPATDNASDITKVEWLNAIVPMLPGLICKGFLNDQDLKARLDTIKMDYNQCISVVPESVTKCRGQLEDKIPEKITNEEAATWGKALGECIGKDFAMKYLIPKQ